MLTWNDLRSRWLLRAAATLLLLVAAQPAAPQYFGQNRVQYDRFEFEVTRTPRFDIYYYPAEAKAVELAARMLERWYARLSTVLGHELRGRQPMILYAAHPHFRQTNTTGGEPGEGTGGFTEALRRRIVLPFAGGMAATDHVLGHELVHAFQFDMTTPQPGSPGGQSGPAALRYPLWFIEGMAEYLSVGPVDAQTALWMREAASRDALPHVKDLDHPRYFPYRYGHAFWAYVASRWGDRVLGDVLRSAPSARSAEDVLTRLLGEDLDALTRGWHEAIRRAQAPFLEAGQPAGRVATQLASAGDDDRGDLNVGPSLSPDGTQITFLSGRGLFSIDLYLADARSGEVIRRLVRTDTDPHFDSLQFLESAGAWHPAGRQLAIAAVRKGDPVLTIIDTERAQIAAEIPLREVDEIFNPTWSPDGRRVAFSAMRGGMLDLYLVDVESRATERLTNDAFAEIHPQWSPDGTRIAFATDRFTSDLDALAFGPHRLATLDLATRAIESIPTFDSGDAYNPQWMPGGRALAFLATPDGVPNVYRRDLQTGRIDRLSNVRSGVTGITATSPALSVAASSGHVAFTAFENNGYGLYAAEAARLAEAHADVPEASRSAAALVPAAPPDPIVARYLESPVQGLPPAPVTSEPEPYEPALELEFVSQTMAGVGFDRYGAFAAGGVALSFSDMLGDHSLLTVIQANGGVRDIGGGAMYINRSRRVNWGVIADQTPYVTGAFSNGISSDDGGLAYVEQDLLIRQTNRGLTGLAQYPFSRALRAEVMGGFRNISFDRELTTRVYDYTSGVLLSEQEEDLDSPESIRLGEFSAALVRDTSLPGLTGPIAGQRWRLEASRTAGDLAFTGLLADVRQYTMPFRPVTIAARVLHYGRFGGDSEDPRLSPLFLGSPGLVHGYTVDSFDASECGVATDGRCPAFDRLIGSRILLGNLEVRAPIVGLFDRSTFYGPVPVEIAVFADAGRAWTRDESFASRDWARSVGAALRANAFGFAVVELSYSRPLDRPGRGWIWDFNLIPAF